MLTLQKITQDSITAQIELPPSKSLANRILIIQALAGKLQDADWASAGNDVVVLKNALFTSEEIADFEDAGTPLRFYIAFAALTGSQKTITGGDRLKQRPLRPLLLALEQLGTVFEWEQEAYQLPFRIQKKLDPSKTEVEIDRTESSQFVSALMLIAPYFDNGLTIYFKGERTSEPYLVLTIKCMQESGINISAKTDYTRVFPGKYFLNKTALESDWSAATFIYAWAVLSKKAEIFLPNISLHSNQADALAVSVFESFGIRSTEFEGGIKLNKTVNEETDLDIDISQNPDFFPVLVALACIQKRMLTVRGIANLKFKESDRVAAMQENVLQCGCHFNRINENMLSLTFIDEEPEAYAFKAFNDHRIAMACSLFAFKKDIVIDDEQVILKSFPDYWGLFIKTLYA